MSKDIFNDNRREYGNGLQKFEPNDINKAMMVNLEEIDKNEEEKILKLYFEYRKSELAKMPDKDLLNQIDSAFKNIFTE